MTRDEHIAWIKAIRDSISGGDEEFDNKRRESLDAGISALEQEPCEDAISREALKKMLMRLDKWHVKNKQFVNVGLLYDDVFFGIEQLPSVTPSRPTEHKPICDDCIYFDNGKGSEKCDSCELTGTNKPSRHKGHWISHILSIECSECKQKFFADDENENCQDYDACEDFGFKYCPNCGAEMESEENGTEN